MQRLQIRGIARWAVGLGACALGFVITPERLIQLGVMSNSLTSEHEMTRSVAQLEVAVLRFGLAAFGLMLLFLLPRVGRFAQHPRIEPLLSPLAPQVEMYQRKFFTWPLLIFTVTSCAMLASVLSHSEPWDLTLEDGPFEQSTALTFLAAGLIGTGACSRRGWVMRTIPLALLSVFFLLAAGEEISWGQRIFNHETPALLQEYNVQQETNIHNLFGYLADHAFIAGAFLYGAVLPLMCAYWPAIHRMMWHLGIPVGSVGLAACFIGASLFHEWTIGRFGGAWSLVRVQEIREALTGLAFLMLTVEALKLERLQTLGTVAARHRKHRIARPRPAGSSRANTHLPRAGHSQKHI